MWISNFDLVYPVRAYRGDLFSPKELGRQDIGIKYCFGSLGNKQWGMVLAPLFLKGRAVRANAPESLNDFVLGLNGMGVAPSGAAKDWVRFTPVVDTTG